MAPQIVSELKRYILFELSEAERNSIRGVSNERDLYEIIKTVGTKLLFKETDWKQDLQEQYDNCFNR